MRLPNFFKTKLAAPLQQPEKTKRYLPYTPKSISRVRQDINSWNSALNMYNDADYPRTYPLQLLYNEIMLDAHLTSQIENRRQQVFSTDFSLKNAKGDADEEQTLFLNKLTAYRTLTNLVIDQIYYGYSLCELSIANGVLNVAAVPRTNVVPKTGLFFPDYTDELKTIEYRNMREYGTWILEFKTDDPGLLNKAVSHVLFKRFAQSCWSELCEIYGIPPRVMKTNTQDNVMLKRAETMMKDMGAAAWFIIDETESFEWAKAADTNGDVYKNLIKLCSDEISLLISGAVIGQDTKNGSLSKDQSAQEMQWLLVQSDMQLIEAAWNNSIIPALVKIGILKPGLTFAFDPVEDNDQLWQRTKEALPFYNVDPEWVKDKFGIEITGERQQQAADPNQLKWDADFFG